MSFAAVVVSCDRGDDSETSSTNSSSDETESTTLSGLETTTDDPEPETETGDDPPPNYEIYLDVRTGPTHDLYYSVGVATLAKIAGIWDEDETQTYDLLTAETVGVTPNAGYVAMDHGGVIYQMPDLTTMVAWAPTGEQIFSVEDVQRRYPSRGDGVIFQHLNDDIEVFNSSGEQQWLIAYGGPRPLSSARAGMRALSADTMT